MVIAAFSSADTCGTMGATIDAAADKANGPRQTKAVALAAVADPPDGGDPELGEDAPPTAVERVAWGTSEAENPYTPEYRAWLETQAGDVASAGSDS